jgi:hypothetical protein
VKKLNSGGKIENKELKKGLAELTAPVVFKNEEKRIVYGPVLIPDEPDSDNDVVSAEKIEEVAHKFVEQYGNIDLQHSLNNVGKLVESYILPFDWEIDENTVIPKGSWIMGVRVTDDETWNAVKNGKLGGFSIMAIQRTAIKSAKNKHASKRVTLADLGQDWIVNAVSLVDEPAVPKAKWIAIKSRDKNIDNNTNININTDGKEIGNVINDNLDELENDQQQGAENKNGEQVTSSGSNKSKEGRSRGFLDKLKESIGIGSKTSEKAGRIFSESNYQRLKQAKEVIDELLSLAEKERENSIKEKGAEKQMDREEVQSMINEAIEPISSKIDDIIDVLRQSNGEDSENDSEKEKGGKEKEESDKEKSDKEEKDNQEEKSTKSKNDGEEDYKELYQSALKQLDKLKKRPFSHRLAGQDGVEKSKDDKEPEDDRNAFGFKRSK